MTRTSPFDEVWFMDSDIVQEYEARLRALKGGDYSTEGTVHGFRIRQKDRQDGEQYAIEEVDLDKLALAVAVQTNDGRRIMVEMDSPTTGWDMTSDLVVFLEYLDLEPEQLGRLEGSDEYTVPVTFNTDAERYEVDFSRMRDDVLDGE